MGGESGLTCITHYNTNSNGSYKIYDVEGHVYTRSFSEQVEEIGINVPIADFPSDYDGYYKYFFEPAWRLCYNPFSAYNDNVILRAQGSAVSSEWIYDGKFKDATPEVLTTVSGSDPFVDGNISYTGMWSGRA